MVTTTTTTTTVTTVKKVSTSDAVAPTDSPAAIDTTEAKANSIPVASTVTTAETKPEPEEDNTIFMGLRVYTHKDGGAATTGGQLRHEMETAFANLGVEATQFICAFSFVNIAYEAEVQTHLGHQQQALGRRQGQLNCPRATEPDDTHSVSMRENLTSKGAAIVVTAPSRSFSIDSSSRLLVSLEFSNCTDKKLVLTSKQGWKSGCTG
ncbi:hypothetical protein K438DRAFT_1958912 [Mycena galopus ATCC 62051]|nr:hypothetical protein K438DRAFT_1958912 [Mycena galopus ATCC 62051]